MCPGLRLVSEFAQERVGRQYFIRTELNAWAYTLASQKAFPQALTILALNTRLHAQSWNAFDNYGEVLEQSGDRRGAIDNYRRSLALNPGNQNAVDHLIRLEHPGQ